MLENESQDVKSTHFAENMQSALNFHLLECTQSWQNTVTVLLYYLNSVILILPWYVF